MITIHDQLKALTTHVRITKGTGAAIKFYVEYIQPIQDYFGGNNAVNETELQTKENDTENNF